MLHRVAQPAGPNPRKRLRVQEAADLGAMQFLVGQLPPDASFFPQEKAASTPAGSASASSTGAAGELTPKGPSSSAALHEVTPARQELEAQAAVEAAASFLLDSPWKEGEVSHPEAGAPKEAEDRPEEVVLRAPDEPELKAAEVPTGPESGSPPRTVEVAELEGDGAPGALAGEPTSSAPGVSELGEEADREVRREEIAPSGPQMSWYGTGETGVVDVTAIRQGVPEGTATLGGMLWRRRSLAFGDAAPEDTGAGVEGRQRAASSRGKEPLVEEERPPFDPRPGFTVKGYVADVQPWHVPREYASVEVGPDGKLRARAVELPRCLRDGVAVRSRDLVVFSSRLMFRARPSRAQLFSLSFFCRAWRPR
jgi:hypothetical protein